jgi:hypothetical protein
MIYHTAKRYDVKRVFRPNFPEEEILCDFNEKRPFGGDYPIEGNEIAGIFIARKI